MPRVVTDDTTYLVIFSYAEEEVIWWDFNCKDPAMEDGDGAWCPTLVAEVRAWRV